MTGFAATTCFVLTTGLAFKTGFVCSTGLVLMASLIGGAGLLMVIGFAIAGFAFAFNTGFSFDVAGFAFTEVLTFATGFVSTTGLTNAAGLAAVTVFEPDIDFMSDAGFTLETVLIFIAGLTFATGFVFVTGLTLTAGFALTVADDVTLPTVSLFFSVFFFSVVFFTSVVGLMVFADKLVPFTGCWLAITTGLLASVLGFLMFDTALSLPKIGNAVSNDMPAAVARPRIHSRFITDLTSRVRQ